MSGIRQGKFVFLIIMAVFLAAAQAWGAPSPGYLLSDYDGNYAGTYSGGDNGVWIALHDVANDIHGILLYSKTDDVFQ